MSFVKNENIQMCLNSSYLALTQREKKFLKESWAESFRNNTFPYINEERFSVLYSSNTASRPNTPVNVLAGLSILKEMIGLSDEEAAGALLFDARYQYALCTDSFEEQPISKNSLSNFRCAIYHYYEETGIDLIEEEVKDLAKHYKKEMYISGKTIRMDSLMIATSSRNLSRLELIFQCVARAVLAISKCVPELLTADFSKYLKEGYRNEVIYYETGKSIEDKMEILRYDSVLLQEMIAANRALSELVEIQLFMRMFAEQMKTTEGEPVWIGKRMVPASALQSPTDKDATHRKKAGKDYVGYVGNIVESFEENGVAIIDSYDLQPNSYSDPTFSKDVIAEIEGIAGEEGSGDGTATVQLIVDGAYYAHEIDVLAKDKGIDMIPTALTGRKDGADSLNGFIIDDENKKIKTCPSNQEMMDSNYSNGRYFAHIEKSKCEGCPHFGNCPVEQLKTKNRIAIYESSLHINQKKNEMRTKEYWEIANKRAGVEGIPSVLRNKYRIDHMPVYGRMRAKIWYGIKIAAINAKRRIAYAI